MTAFPYEGAYLGLLLVYHRYAPNYGYLEEQLVYSDDSVHWRPAGNGLFLPSGPPGAWDAGCVGAGPNVVMLEDRILFYYTGTPRSHGGGGPASAPPTALGLATLRRDGFAYLQPPWHEGVFVTHPFSTGEEELHLNASAVGGEVSAAVLGEDRKPLPGYAHEDCAPARWDGIDQVLRWRGRERLPSGAEVRLELRLRDAILFSFWTGDAGR